MKISRKLRLDILREINYKNVFYTNFAIENRLKENIFLVEKNRLIKNKSY